MIVVLATKEIALRDGNKEMIVVLATKEIACNKVNVVLALKEIARRVGNEEMNVVLATKEIARQAGDEVVLIVLARMGAHACNDGQHGKNSGPLCWQRGPRDEGVGAQRGGGMVWYFLGVTGAR